uniref:Uncharacterized protein n=1 Tax=Siphoviridae sp. ctHip2 TaxID=2827830 RepID=A0A8S5RWC2_9CAUD|nr:MAG TPA: hypothetical protein [Siphoviridae sp. ctHip2]
MQSALAVVTQLFRASVKWRNDKKQYFTGDYQYFTGFFEYFWSFFEYFTGFFEYFWADFSISLLSILPDF